MTKFYGLPLDELFILKNPCGNNNITSSKQEIQLADYLSKFVEHGDVKHKFNTKLCKLRFGRKKRIHPDILIYPNKAGKKKGFTKEAIYFQVYFYNFLKDSHMVRKIYCFCFQGCVVSF